MPGTAEHDQSLPPPPPFNTALTLPPAYPRTSVWSCYASDVCQHLNGTCGGGNGGSCPNGEVQTQTCSGVASCCCSYQYTGSDATVCTSEAVCTQLGGSC